MSEKRTECRDCGAFGPPTEYHPFAFCLLVKAYGGRVDTARKVLNEILDHGRRLERAGLPNHAKIGQLVAREKNGASPPPRSR